jgi:ribosomal-protein-alanine N-acetyltransferase
LARREPDRLDWMVSSEEGAVGRVSLAHIDYGEGVAEVGYWILSESRRQGFASLALGLVETHAFTELGLGRLVIRHEPDNTASCAFADRKGYRAEGTQRGAFVRGGVRRDLHVHSRLADDPRDW